MVCPPPPPIDLWVGEVSSLKCRWIAYGLTEHFMVFFIDYTDSICTSMDFSMLPFKLMLKIVTYILIYCKVFYYLQKSL